MQKIPSGVGNYHLQKLDKSTNEWVSLGFFPNVGEVTKQIEKVGSKSNKSWWRFISKNSTDWIKFQA